MNFANVVPSPSLELEHGDQNDAEDTRSQRDDDEMDQSSTFVTNENRFLDVFESVFGDDQSGLGGRRKFMHGSRRRFRRA